jgi:hypothetical protein
VEISETGERDESEKNIDSGGNIPYLRKNYLRNGAVLAGALLAVGYIGGGILTGVWTPKQMKAYSEKVRIEQQIEAEHKGDIDYKFNILFKNAKNFQDSVDVYNKYGLPIKLLTPTHEEKEEAVKQSELERSVW